MSKPIVFFGSGPVAAASLGLLAEVFEIEAVITKPRAAHHGGDVPVLELSEARGFKTLTASTKAELVQLIADTTLTSELGILIDYGIIVPQSVIDHFHLGIINSHFSILPEWRGADPITFAILSGQKQTGVSIMLLSSGLDEGPLLSYGEYDIPEDQTTPQLTHELIQLSHALLIHAVPSYTAGNSRGVPQAITGRNESYSRKLIKADGIIDWQKPAEVLEREVRAFIDWPKSRTTLGDVDIIITKSAIIDLDGPPGTLSLRDQQLVVHCGKGSLILDTVIPAGKKAMSGKAFITGRPNLLTDRH